MAGKSVLVLSIMMLAAAGLFAQDAKALLEGYSKNFDSGNLEAKLRLIQDAAGLNNPTLASLFLRALNYAVSTSEQGRNLSIIRQISVLAVAQCERYKYLEARGSIWKLFLLDDDSNTRFRCLKALGALAGGDKAIISGLNDWLSAEVNSFKAGKSPKPNLILRVILSLGELADDSSFPVVFNAMHAGFSQEIGAACLQTLTSLKGDFKTLLMDIVKNGTTGEKYEALIIALGSAHMSETAKGEIAEVSLDTALGISSAAASDLKELRGIRLQATRALGARKWSKAAPLVLKNFELTLGEFERGAAGKPELLDVIRALGNLGVYETADRLALYLDALNNYSEKKNVYDEQIVMEVIDALGRLGDKVAFEYLMNVKFLNYSAMIKTRADEAIKNLKW